MLGSPHRIPGIAGLPHAASSRLPGAFTAGPVPPLRRQPIRVHPAPRAVLLRPPDRVVEAFADDRAHVTKRLRRCFAAFTFAFELVVGGEEHVDGLPLACGVVLPAEIMLPGRFFSRRCHAA